MGGEDRVTDGLELTFLIKPEDGEWVGLCLELDIAADAETKEKVIEVLSDLVGLYFAGCADTGNVPAPLRPVPADALREFLAPPDQALEMEVIAHREHVLANAAA